GRHALFRRRPGAAPVVPGVTGRRMKGEPAMVVVVEGHTDAVGSDAYNMKLSQRRADTVRDYMVKNGITPSRIKTEAFGKTRPIASNKTAEGRAQNRRVEIVAQ